MSENYPICVNTGAYRDDIVKMHDQVDGLGRDEKFSELIELLEKYRDLVNSCKLPDKDSNKRPSLFTPLHYAASSDKVSKNEFEKLIAIGASRCLKTADGDTAYDLAKKNGRPSDILKVLEIPEEIKKRASEIQKMEEGLHKVINGRVENLIKKNNQELPQLALLYEMEGHNYYYPVPGMYGGFSISEREDGSIQADSWVRVCGGSEENHHIDKDGKVKLLPNDNPL